MKDKQVAVSDLSGKEQEHLEQHSERAAWLSNTDKKAVLGELDRLIASSLFSSSHRCQSLLRFVVQSALEGKADSLKERSIGGAVFGRDLTYDTNSDPVVRVVAGEVRKKLALYYSDSENHSEIRIVMRVGSYVPEFFWSNLRSSTSEGGPSAQLEDVGSPSQTAVAARWSRPVFWWLLAGLVVAVASALLIWRFQPKPPDAFETFWAPVVKSPSPVMLCVGHRMLTWSEYYSDPSHVATAPLAKSPKNGDQKNRAVMLLSDSATLGGLTALLQEEKKRYWVRGQEFVTFEDLQAGPVVLLGAFNNQWTMRFMKPMRFHFAEDPNGSSQWIADQQALQARIGLVQADTEGFTTEDYALVARVFDPQTKRPTIIVAGVTATATHAAGEFVTDPDYLNDFSKRAPQNWQTKNMELLIVTNNVKGDSGSPKVVASYFW